MSAALSSNQSLCRLSMLPRVDCEAIRRAEERACHSIVRFEVQFNVVVVDLWDRDWAMAFHLSSDILLVGCSHTEFLQWLLFTKR